MPHSIFLGSALSTQNRVADETDKLSRITTTDTEATLTPSRALRPSKLLGKFKAGVADAFRIAPIEEFASDPKNHAEHENNTYAFVRAHIYHGMIDITLSLLGIAVVINSL